MYIVNEGAKKWYAGMKEWADDGNSIVVKPTLKEKEKAAKQMTKDFEQAFESKEYDFMKEPEQKKEDTEKKAEVETEAKGGTFSHYDEMAELTRKAFASEEKAGKDVSLRSDIFGDGYTVTLDFKPIIQGTYEEVKKKLEDKIGGKEIASDGKEAGAKNQYGEEIGKNKQVGDYTIKVTDDKEYPVKLYKDKKVVNEFMDTDDAKNWIDEQIRGKEASKKVLEALTAELNEMKKEKETLTAKIAELGAINKTIVSENEAIKFKVALDRKVLETRKIAEDAFERGIISADQEYVIEQLRLGKDPRVVEAEAEEHAITKYAKALRGMDDRKIEAQKEVIGAFKKTASVNHKNPFTLKSPILGEVDVEDESIVITALRNRRNKSI